MYASTVRNLLVRGMLAGLVAGLLAFAVAYVVGEPPVDDAIAVEEAQAAPDAHAGHHHGDAAGEAAEEEEVVSRSLQSTVGLGTGVLVYGVALGGVAALAFSFAWGRIGRFSPQATAALTAAGAFTAIYLVPFLKYPATPPAVGNPDTIGRRTTLFFLMILLSVLLAVAAVIVGRRLAPRLGNWNATLVAGAGFIAAVAIAYVFLPANDDAIREGFPAALLWRFRIASLMTQAVLWTAFGVVFGFLAQRLLSPRPARSGAPLEQQAPVPG
ncbi:CbtA family protein [Yinghuangia sp. ASG 101]|uniref:CbtA family protein n=1 Tax=Yinghuangia sp. ASG 101 TaxID=2896848 RepID=UPI001E2BB1AC|nr:CbtA family protein [Yinghuangia sp. ASG 101]UGQ11704.1 CbtA family protein [Yinghuangia sp. ASG 101]